MTRAPWLKVVVHLPFLALFVNRAVDLTDRFDFSFLCGDLNFRLDISRLHADWLISRQGLNGCFSFQFH